MTTAILALSVVALTWLAYRQLSLLEDQAEAITSLEARLEALIIRLHGKCVMVDVGGGRFALLELDLMDSPQAPEWKVSRN